MTKLSHLMSIGVALAKITELYFQLKSGLTLQISNYSVHESKKKLKVTTDDHLQFDHNLNNCIK